MLAISTDKGSIPSKHQNLIIINLEYIHNIFSIICINLQNNPTRIGHWGSEIDKKLSVRKFRTQNIENGQLSSSRTLMLGQYTFTLHHFHPSSTLRAVGSIGSSGSLPTILHKFNEIFDLYQLYRWICVKKWQLSLFTHMSFCLSFSQSFMDLSKTSMLSLGTYIKGFPCLWSLITGLIIV
jgi:hypothetical protein